MAEHSVAQWTLAGITFDSGEFWWEVSGGGWATAAVLLLIFFLQLARTFAKRRAVSTDPANSVASAAPASLPLGSTSTRISGIISDADLKDLITNLDGKSNESEKWEEVIAKKNGSISYHARCCRPKDGPLKYLSVTIFDKCSTELLRDFYMDTAMVAVAASPTPGAAGSPFATRSHDHPPYKDMVLSALEALKGPKGSSRPAISKYIADNYSDLPPTHSSLLSHQLRRLHSKGVIRFFKNSYKLADPPTAGNGGADTGSKKRGRPRKNVQPVSSVFDGAPRRRGRPRKIGADAPTAKKIRPGQLQRPKIPAVVDPTAVYILPQAEQLKSGFLQSLPGAVAIVLPEGLLSKKTAKSPVLILPNGVQSLVDTSPGKKKLRRPKKFEVVKKPDQPKVVGKRQSGLSRRKAVLPKQVLLHDGNTNVDYVNSGPKKLRRPRKSRDSVLPENGHLKSFNPDNLATTGTEQGLLEKAENSAISESETVQALHNTTLPELKKRSVGRPKKNIIVEGPKTPRTTAIAT